jgi:hypothetical protein
MVSFFTKELLMSTNQNNSTLLALKTQRRALRLEIANLERHITKNQQMRNRLEDQIRILMEVRRAA